LAAHVRLFDPTRPVTYAAYPDRGEHCVNNNGFTEAIDIVSYNLSGAMVPAGQTGTSTAHRAGQRVLSAAASVASPGPDAPPRACFTWTSCL